MNRNKKGVMPEVTREVYKNVKKYDRQQFAGFCTELYKYGYEDGRESVPGVDPEEVMAAVAQARGVGKRTLLIIDTPADCRDCVIRSLGDDCMAMGRHVKEYRENKCRPEWCPLEEVKESSVERCIAHLERHGYIALEFNRVSKKDTQKAMKCSCSVCLVQ